MVAHRTRRPGAAWRRVAWAGVVAIGTACSSTDIGAPVVTGVQPAERTEDSPLRVEITGRDFVPRLSVRPSGKATVDAAFKAEVLPPGGAKAVPLLDVRFKSPEALTATIPAGLVPGMFGVRIVSPAGDDASLSNAFRNKLAPEISHIEPVTATVVGGGKIRIFGRRFVEGAVAGLAPGCPDGEPGLLTAPSRESDGLISGFVPPNETPGPIDVWVTTEHGTGCLVAGFTYVPVREPPVVLGIDPALGPTAGDTQVVIEVGNIAADAIARVGGKTLSAQAIDVETGTVTGFTRPGEPGFVNVEVEAPGVGKGILPDAFRYVADPVVASVTPDSGPETGGTQVRIRGDGFIPPIEVLFGGVPATGVQVSDERALRCATPAGRGATTVEVRREIGGQGALQNGFTYRQPPVITSVLPTEGRSSGNEAVVIRGERLDGDGLLVTFGGRLLGRQQVIDAGQVVGILPAGTGKVAVAVSGADGMAYKPDAFTYRPRPEVALVRPRRGRAGDELEVRGRGFLADTSVRLGDAALLSIQVQSPNHLTGIVPEGQGLQPLVVEHAFGASDPVPDAFSYEPADATPQLHAIHPGQGPEAGGNRFWIEGSSLPDEVTVRFGDATSPDAVAVDGRVIVGTVPPGNGDRRPSDVIVRAGGVSPRLGAAYAYSAPGPLRVDAVVPSAAPEDGGVPVVVRGGGFTTDTRILVGGRPLRRTVLVHDGELRGVLPAGAGEAGVAALDRGGDGRGAFAPGAVRYVGDGDAAAGAVIPASGPAGGLYPVEIRGAGLTGVDAVTFGDAPALDVDVIDDTLVIATVPPQAPGLVSVSLCFAGQCPAELSLPLAFELLGDDAPPRIEAIVPPEGHRAGGAEIAVLGGPFPDDVGLLWANGEPLAVTWEGPHMLTAVVPPGDGAVDVVVQAGGVYARAPRGFRYTGDRPAIAGFDPAAGPARGAGTVLTIQGQRFVPDRTRVFVGDTELIDVELAGTTGLTAVLPPAPPGVHDLAVETPDGAATRAAAFEVREPVSADLEVVQVFPREGPADGGVPVLIQGIHLDRAVAGDIGGAALDRLVQIDAATLLAITTPGDVGGTVGVRVAEGGAGAHTLLAAYAYRPVPDLLSVEPAASARAGGEVVTVRFARGLTADTVVEVDGLVLASPNPDVGAGSFTGVLPPGEAGRRDLVAINEWGRATLEAAVRFIAPPVADRTVPSTGLLGGGGLVSVRGSGFDNETTVVFGARQLLNLTRVSSERIDGTLPAGFGIVDVRVENSFGRSTLREGFTYLVAPRIASLTPFMGPTAGGTPVTITGAGLGAETVFEVGGRALEPTGPGVPVVRDTETAVGVVPAGDEPGWVRVSLRDHRGDDNEAEGWRYLPDVEALDGPAQVPAAPVRAVASHAVSGATWVATEAGLFRVDPAADAVTGSPATPYALPSERARALLIEPGGALAVGTDGGLAICASLAQLQCRHLDHRELTGAGEQDGIFALAALADGHLLAGGPGGVFRIDPANVDPPLAFGFGGAGPPGGAVRGMAVAGDGRVWLATDGGLAVFDPGALSFATHDGASSGGGLGDDDVRAVAVSAAGVVWAGTASGLFGFRPAAGAAGWSSVADVEGETVHAIEVAPSGDLWIGTDRGALRLSGSPPAIASERTADDGLPDDRVYAIHVGARGGVWIGTAAGLARHAGP